MGSFAKELKINVWNHVKVANTIIDIIVRCVEYVHQRSGIWLTSDQIINFAVATVRCMNVYDPEYGEPKRPQLKINDDLLLLFDNGITQDTTFNNYPSLYIRGVPLSEIKGFENDDIEVGLGLEMIRVTFKGDNYFLQEGWGKIPTMIPVRSLTEEVIEC